MRPFGGPVPDGHDHTTPVKPNDTRRRCFRAAPSWFAALSTQCGRISNFGASDGLPIGRSVLPPAQLAGANSDNRLSRMQSRCLETVRLALSMVATAPAQMPTRANFSQVRKTLFRGNWYQHPRFAAAGKRRNCTDDRNVHHRAYHVRDRFEDNDQRHREFVGQTELPKHGR